MSPYRVLTDSERSAHNQIVSHPLQAWEWGEFRRVTGIEVVRMGAFTGKKLASGFQVTFHRLPFLPFTIGYLPKGPSPTQEMIAALTELGRKHQAIFIKLEPNVEKLSANSYLLTALKPSPKPLFTKYTFYLDLTKSEAELLQAMHPKTRYNIRVAQKHGVTIQEENSAEAFSRYLELTQETTKRQGFYAHDENYHRKMWGHFSHQPTTHNSQLTTHLLTARYQDEILVTWIVFLFNDKLYYPYGASASEHREVMASNLMLWEAMRWGKTHGAKIFDLWGTPGPDPKPTDPYYGFHRFKLGYGPKLIEFVGTYDLILKPFYYKLFNVIDKLRWLLLKLKTKTNFFSSSS